MWLNYRSTQPSGRASTPPRSPVPVYHPQVHDYSSAIPSTTYPVQHYNPALHLFDVHSWGFASGPPNLGFGIQSTDKMELISASDSVIYNSNEEAAGFAANVSYARFFP